MIKGIHHAAISTSDLDRSLKFYRDLLGFKVTFELDFGEGDEVLQRLMALGGKAAGRLALLRADNAFIELFQFTSPSPQPVDPRRPVCDHGLTHVCCRKTARPDSGPTRYRLAVTSSLARISIRREAVRH